jgi:type VI secretion system protein ImpH
MCTVVSNYFDGVMARIEDFVPREAEIPADQRNRLGQANSTLLTNLSLGGSAPDACGKFRLHLGPLSFARFCDFLPNGRDFGTLRTLVRYLCRDPLSFDVVLWIKHTEIPILCLGKSAPRDGARPAGQRQLGLTAWLGKRPLPDKDQPIAFRDCHPVLMEN